MQRMSANLFFVPPMECREVKSVDDVPTGKGWQYEVKFDGYRCIAIKQRNEVQLFSRRGLAFEKFLNVHRALLEQPAKSFVLDGEIVALDQDGRSNFNALQNAGRAFNVHFYPFDLLHLEDEELTDLPLAKRQARLQAEFVAGDFVHLLRPLAASLKRIIPKIRQFGFEGIVAKQKESIYLPGKTPGSWVKLKLKPTEEFVVGGFIPSGRAADELVVGRYAGKHLMYVAAFDDGFIPATRRKVFEEIKRYGTPDCPFANLPEKRGRHRMDAEKMKSVVWIKPKVVAEVAMNEWTPDGHLRHAEFKRLRDDVNVRQVRAYPFKDVKRET
jgi:DNA ligase D-like protein (predicted ligase)